MLYFSLAPLRPGAEPTLVVDVAPVGRSVRLGDSRSRLSHRSQAPKGDRTPNGFAAPRPRSYLLCAPAAATQWQNAAPVKIPNTTGSAPGRPRAGGQNGPGLGL
jgi:hypothetical protein